MSAIAAIAVFPVLTLLLFWLARVETDLARRASESTHRRPADPPRGTETSPE